MGNTSPLLPSLNISPLWHQLPSSSPSPHSHKLFIHSTNNQLSSQHITILSQSSSHHLISQLTIYLFRKTQHLNLVRIHGVTISQPNSTINCCGGTKYMRVLVEYLPIRLKDLEAYSFQEGLYVFNQLIGACNAIVTKIGAIVFEDSMFGVTEDGRVKVWVNSNFEVNYPQKKHQMRKASVRENEREMVISLVRVVGAHVVGGGFPEEFVKPIEGFEELNFVSFQAYVEKFADMNRVVIPNRIDMKRWRREEIVNEVVELREKNLGEELFVQRNMDYNTSPPLFPYGEHPQPIVHPQPLFHQQHHMIRHSQQIFHPPIQNIVTRVLHHSQPITTQLPPSAIFPRYQIPQITQLSHQVSNPLPINIPSTVYDSSEISIRKPMQLGSILTTDRTLSQLDNRNSINNTNISTYNPVRMSSINQPSQHILIEQSMSQQSKIYQNRGINQIHSLSDVVYLPRQVIPHQRVQIRQYLPPIQQIAHSPIPLLPRSTLPLSTYPSFPQPQLNVRMSPQSLPIPLTLHQQYTNYITHPKQLQKQQQLYMTTTTYKNHPQFKFQYRTIHPQSVFLVADESMKPQVKRVKLEKKEILGERRPDGELFE